MAGFRDFLMRFRRMRPPGPAATGVPADRAAELAEELGPPLSLLERTEAEAARVRADAERRAQRRHRAADRLAGQIVAQARGRAPAVRAESAAAEADRRRAETARFVTAAESDLAALRGRAEQRMPALVDRLAAKVIDGLRGTGEPSGAGPAGTSGEQRSTGSGTGAPGAPENRRGPREGGSPWAPDG